MALLADAWYHQVDSTVIPFHIGEQVKSAGAIRYMEDPALDGSSPRCYSTSIGTLDPHYGAGPANHMRYLLTYCGTSACNNNAVTGIGVDEARQLWYASIQHLNTTTTYADLKQAYQLAAEQLFGLASLERLAVDQAFDAINVP